MPAVFSAFVNNAHASYNNTYPYSLYEYSGTPPYDHPVYKTTSLLRPYSFKPNVKTIESFSYFEDPVNATTSLLRPGFYGPTVVALTGFHCSVILCRLMVQVSVKGLHKYKKLKSCTYFCLHSCTKGSWASTLSKTILTFTASQSIT